MRNGGFVPFKIFVCTSSLKVQKCTILPIIFSMKNFTAIYLLQFCTFHPGALHIKIMITGFTEQCVVKGLK